MGIIAWFKKRRLHGRKKSQDLRLSEIRTGLQKIQRRQPRMRPMIQPELARVRELKKQLNKVNSEEEMKFWLSLFNMCIPVFDVLLNTAQAENKKGKSNKYRKK